MGDGATLLDEGAWVLTESFRAHRFKPILGGSANSGDVALSAVLRKLLESAPVDALCNVCVAFALDVSPQKSAALMSALAGEGRGFRCGARRCARCQRHTFTIRYEPRKAPASA